MSIRKYVLLLISSGVMLLAVLMPGQAQASTKLPKQYSGNWYAYEYVRKDNHVKTYSILQLKISSTQFSYNTLKSTHSDLSQSYWQWGDSTRINFTRHVNHHGKVSYIGHGPGFDESVRLKLQQVKVHGKMVHSLFVDLEENEMDLFRQPIKTHSLGDDYDVYSPISA